MKRLTLLATAALLSTITGCCCGWPGMGCGPCGGGYGGYGGCGPGGCNYGAPAGPAYTPQGMYQSYDSVTGLPAASTTAAYAPNTNVALGPMEALPTYR